MSRGLASAFKTALGSGVVRPAFFAEFQFDSGTTRFWTGESSITTDLGGGSVTWTGGGLLGSMVFSGESESTQAKTITFTLNGVDQSFYATAIETEYRGRPVKVWFALMSSDFASVSYYYLMEEARMDTLSISEPGDTITLMLKCESRLVDLFSARRCPLSNEQLQKEYPTDTFYEYTSTLPGKKMPWGMLLSSSSGRSATSGNASNPQSGNYRQP